MAIRLVETNDEVSVIVTGDLDLSSVGAFQTEANKALSIRNGRKLVVDLHKTSYIDSAGLEHLLILNRKLSTDHERLLVRVEQEKQPHNVLTVTGFGAVMDVEASKQQDDR